MLFWKFFLPSSDQKKEKIQNEPTHLMFNMATGTGENSFDVSTILYYYEQGYRHFLFFVNQNNIVDKTENNFIDNTHTKYLFKEKSWLMIKPLPSKVDTFSNNPQGMKLNLPLFKNSITIFIYKEKIRPLWTICIARISLCLWWSSSLETDTKQKYFSTARTHTNRNLQEQPVKQKLKKEAGSIQL